MASTRASPFRRGPGVGEVRLLDAAVLQRQLAVQDGGEAEGHCRFELRADAERVDVDAAVQRADDLVNAEAAVRDRHLRHLGRPAPERLVHGDPAAAAARERLAPARLLGGEVEHGEMPRVLLQELAAILERVLPGRVRELVHERLHDECGV